jgi:hypothetical protein
MAPIPHLMLSRQPEPAKHTIDLLFATSVSRLITLRVQSPTAHRFGSV